jgi:hypothetical protein
MATYVVAMFKHISELCHFMYANDSEFLTF